MKKENIVITEMIGGDYRIEKGDIILAKTFFVEQDEIQFIKDGKLVSVQISENEMKKYHNLDKETFLVKYFSKHFEEYDRSIVYKNTYIHIDPCLKGKFAISHNFKLKNFKTLEEAKEFIDKRNKNIK